MTTKTKKTGSGKPTQKNAAKPKKSFPVLPVIFVGIGALLVAAILLSGEESIGSGGEYGDVAITGDSLPEWEGNASVVDAEPAFGLVAPEISGVDFDGSSVSISHDGTPKAIVFLAHWCSHCQAEVPRVESWLNSTGGVPGVELMSVTTAASSGQPNWPPSSWLDRENWTSPNIRDDSDGTAFDAYGGTSFPYWVFLNGDGTVAYRLAGQTDIQTLQSVMGSLGATG